MGQCTETIDFRGLSLTIDFWYDPEDPGVHTYSNGDPGYPPSPASYEIHTITYNKIDVTAIFDALDAIEEIEEQLEEKKHGYEPEWD